MTRRIMGVAGALVWWNILATPPAARRVIQAHERAAINRVVISRDGHTILTASADMTLKVLIPPDMTLR